MQRLEHFLTFSMLGKKTAYDILKCFSYFSQKKKKTKKKKTALAFIQFASKGKDHFLRKIRKISSICPLLN